MKATEYAGIWGAFLSTAMVLGRTLPDRPRFHLEPPKEHGDDLTIRVVNPASRFLLIRDWRRIRLGRAYSEIGLYTRKTKMADAGKTGGLLLGIPAQDEQSVSVICLGPAVWIVILLWRHTWLLPFWLPCILVLSKRSAADLGNAVLK